MPKRRNERHRWEPNPDAVRPDVELPERNEHGNMPRPSDEVVRALVRYQQEKRGREICGAWRPKKGGVCCKWPLRGRDRCRDCGGKTPRGVEHHAFGVGIFSDVLTEQPSAAEQYHRLLNDKRLMDIREHVAVSTGELKQLYRELVASTPATQQWKEMMRLRSKILATDDGDRATALVFELLDVIERGYDVASKRREFIELQDHTRKLIDSERRHQQKEKLQMSIEAFNVNMAVLADAMKLFFDRGAILQFMRYIQVNVLGYAGEIADHTEVDE